MNPAQHIPESFRLHKFSVINGKLFLHRQIEKSLRKVSLGERKYL